jgi:arsenite/tail-anchored protein-transporting ATPase
LHINIDSPRGPQLAMLSKLTAHRVLMVLGKGGVGKTTVSAAVARAVADSGAPVLAMECDPRAPMAAALGLKPSYVPAAAAPNLALMVLEGRHSLEEYLRLVFPGRALLGAVFASRLYQFFVQAAPGLRELMMLGKIYYECERRLPGGAQRSLIVVDAPASGQALSLLRMPAAARETFGDSIVGREASHIARMLHDRSKCAIVQVTTAEPLAMSETLETYAALAAMRLEPAVVIFNRASAEQFDGRDLAAAERRAAQVVGEESWRHLADIGHRELARIAGERRALLTLRSAVRCPICEVPEYPGLSGAALIRRMADGFLASAAGTSAGDDAQPER